LKASSAQAATSLEHTVDALVNFFGLGFAPFTGNEIDNREALYQRVVTLQTVITNLAANSTLVVDSLPTFSSAADLGNIAQGSTAFGYRYAVRELNPFAILGNNDLYAPHNANGELDLYELATRTGTLTEDWIKDRAKLLYADLIRNSQDISDPQVPVLLPAGDTVTEYHHYRGGKEEVFFAQAANSFPELPTEVVMFADDAGRLLTGTNNLLGDRLYGGSSTDYLIGKANDDSLEGGKGLDIYQYNASNGANDGADVISDTDGKGVLRYTRTQSGVFSNTVQSTVIADASVRTSGIQWHSADGKFSYTRSQDDLIITINGDAGGSITLKDFRDGDFYIHLWEARADPQTTPPDIVGDLEPQDFDPNTDGVQTQTNELGNVIVTTNPEPNRNDVLNDSTANDRIIAGGGNDILRGIRGGDDWMSGDAGRDNLAGGAGADLLEGGADGVFSDEVGGDIAFGDVGNDEIYADTKIALSTAITQGNTSAASGAKGDYLSGGAGDDWIVSAAGDDYLDGGSGQDLIIGGAGDDNIAGDWGFAATSLLWVVDREIIPQDDLTVYTLNFVSGSVSADFGLGAADVIYAGAGVDWVFAGEGDDFVDAGPGDDVVFGMEGDDVLIGGLGGDILVGDNGPLLELNGNDYLDGGEGDDKLEGNSGNDVLIGGTGNDTLVGGTGKDIYVFNKGDGTETVFDDDTNPNNPDASVLVLGDGIAPSAIKFTTGSLAVDIGPSDPADPNSAHEVIHFNGFNQIDPIASMPLAEIRFGDGTDMSYDDILNRGFDIDGTEGDDTGVQNLVGTGVTDRIRGFGGNDLLFGFRGDDMLDGGEGVDQILGGPGVDTIYGGAGGDEIWGDAESGGIFEPDGDDIVYGGAGNDVVQGNGGGDQIFGDDGSDTLYGDDGADVLDGGADNDFLYGQGYFFVGGIPFLNLFDDAASDTLRGGDGNDYLNAAAGDDVLEGGSGDDNLEGEAGADYIAGGDGNDLLWGDKAGSPLADQGNDTLDGGAGNDQLVGYAGNDTYVFGRGYGQDIVFDQDTTAGNVDQVLFAADITPDDVTAVQSGASLVLAISGTTDTLTIANQFVSTADRVEEIRFADGTVWDPNSIPFAIRGTAGNDVLTGTGGADIFEGLAGNDTMSGGAGNDTYRISRGDGQDVITDFDATVGNVDRVLYASNILPSEITASRSGNNLVLRLAGTTDQVTITNYFLNDGATPNSIEQIKFLQNGTIWDVNTVKNAVLTGTSGNDTIVGYATNDALAGLGGNDTLTGNAGNDTLDGGTGNDLLQGGIGNDAYLIARGDGQDTITDVDATVGNVDKIVYAADILPSDVKATRSGNNLVLKLADSTDQVTVTNYFQNDGATTSLVEQIQFADGTSWDLNTLKTLVLTGTDGNDSLTGFASDDVLTGLGGNDTLTGNAGHDTLDGGTGNDLLQGGSGNDTYLIARGNGQDTITDVDATAGNVDQIVYAADIVPSEVRATRSGNNLVLKLTDTTDQVTVTNYFVNDGVTTSSVEQIHFANGTVWDLNTVKSMVLTPTDGDDAITGYATDDNLSGLAGNDVIRGAGGNDTLDGGAGNDNLFGESGSDIYLFARGDGQDVIDNAASDGLGTTDVLSFAADILPGDITPTREVRDLVLSIQGSTDQVRIQNYFFSGTNVVEEIRFADGTVWNEQTILTFLPTPPLVGTEGNDVLLGTLASELIRGLGGNDTLRGVGGNDTFEGGPGEDKIFGGIGNDTYLFNIGDGGPPSFFILGDDISDLGGYDVLQFGADITPSGFSIIDHTDARGRMLVLSPAGTNAGVYIIGYFGTGHIEEIRFQDGTVWTDQTIAPRFAVSGTFGNDNMIGTVIADVMNGFDGDDTINGGAGHDTLDGGAGADRLVGVGGNDSLIGADGADELLGGDGNDTLSGGLGSDTLYGEAGDDILIAGTGEAKNAKVSNLLHGGAGDDVLVSSGKADFLYGEDGNDILLGGNGHDWLEDNGGNNLLSGGGTTDDIWMGNANDLVIGGTGDDLLDGDRDADGVRGADVLLFNKSDGKDSVSRLGTGSTISIGGTLYGNLAFEAVGTTLRLKTSSSHYLALNDWYGDPANRTVATLQIVIEGTRDYSATSADPMKNKKIQSFDFLGLVAAFDASGQSSRFKVASNLADFWRGGSDTEAIGGAVAYQYASTGSIDSLSYDQMRSVIGDPAFAISAQPITASLDAAAFDVGITAVAPANAFAALTLTDTSRSDADRAAADSETTVEEVVTVDSVALEAGVQSIEKGATPSTPDFVTLLDAEIELLPILPEPAAAARTPPHFLTPPTLDLSSFAFDPPGAASSGVRRAHALESMPQSAATSGSRPAPHGPLPGDTPAPAGTSAAQGDAVHAAPAATSGKEDTRPRENDSLLDRWLTRHGLNDDLTLLDEITRDEAAANTSTAGGAVAAAWRRSHAWLNGHLSTTDGRDDASAGGYLEATSFLGHSGTYVDIPRPVVGLRNVAGHDLKPFSGLREGVSILAQQ
jgi:Ca2+-binding RTX toxin-like protein